jgi:hypothetical protein
MVSSHDAYSGSGELKNARNTHIDGQWAGTPCPAGRATRVHGPSLRPRHGTMGHFSCWVGPMCTAFLAGRASPRPNKCQHREREREGRGATTMGGGSGRLVGMLAAHPKALGAISTVTDSELEGHGGGGGQCHRGGGRAHRGRGAEGVPPPSTMERGREPREEAQRMAWRRPPPLRSEPVDTRAKGVWGWGHVVSKGGVHRAAAHRATKRAGGVQREGGE